MASQPDHAPFNVAVSPTAHAEFARILGEPAGQGKVVRLVFAGFS